MTAYAITTNDHYWKSVNEEKIYVIIDIKKEKDK